MRNGAGARSRRILTNTAKKYGLSSCVAGVTEGFGLHHAALRNSTVVWKMNWWERGTGRPVTGLMKGSTGEMKGERKGRASGKQMEGKDLATDWICEQDRGKH